MREIYVDPAYPVYNQDRLFDKEDKVLNRDDSLGPYIRMRESVLRKGGLLQTADALMAKVQNDLSSDVEYYSFGNLSNYHSLIAVSRVRLKAFVIFEPPVVDPNLYKMLPELTAHFERVYVHNVHGNGYSLSGVDVSKLRKLFWPQPRPELIHGLWSKRLRQNRIVVINGNHRPRSFSGELYSSRINAMVELSKFNAVDLYGRDWEKWWSRKSMWTPYFRNLTTLHSIYKGSCVSKYEVLSNYDFALCFENMQMAGYVTEKIFDCLYAGTIPIYLGAEDIGSLIPEECYVDYRKYNSASDMWLDISNFTEEKINKMRDAGANFINGAKYKKYYNSLDEIVG